MNNKSLFSIIIFIIGCICFWQFSEKSAPFSTKSNADTYKKLEAHGILNHQTDILLYGLFSQVVEIMGIGTKIIINGPYNKNAFNVYTIDFNKLENTPSIQKVSFFQRDDFINFTANNFVAVPPNTIFIDQYFLNSLLLDCYNVTLSYSQLAGPYISGKKIFNREEATEEALTENAKATYLRLSNIENYKARSTDSLIDNFGEFDNDLLTSKIYLCYFLPIISHEIAHLISDNYGAFNASSIANFADKFKEHFFGKLKLEEEKADTLMLATIENYFKTNYKTKPFPPKRGIELVQVAGFIKYMRDLVLYDSFQEFRGISAKDHLIQVVHRPVWEWDNKEGNKSFIDHDRVQSASLLPPPFITKIEFRNIMNRIKRKGSSVHHRHIFIRSYDILRILSDIDDISFVNAIQPYYNLLSLSEEELNTSNRRDVNESFEKYKTKLLTSLSDHIGKFEKTITYDDNECLVGFLKDNTGFIELLCSGDGSVQCRLILKTSDKNVTHHDYFHILTKYIKSFFHHPEKHNDFSIALLLTLDEFKDYYPHIIIDENGIIFYAHFLNNTDYLCIEAKEAI